MADGISASARNLDLTGRLVTSSTVVASPSAASETIIASVTIPSGLSVVSGVLVMGWAAYTLGTSAASCQLRIRQTGTSGTAVGNTGAMTGGHNSAGLLVSDDVNGFDTTPADAQVYKLTLTVASAAAASTVSSVLLVALVV